MRNRLEVARELLRDDGVIFVQCDDNEQAYLKVLMDEVFGRENFVNCIAIKMSEASGVKMNHSYAKFPKLKEYLLLYKKNELKFEMIDKYKNEVWDKENNIFLENFTEDDRVKLRELEDKEVISEEDVAIALSILRNVRCLSLSEKMKSLDRGSIDKIEEWKIKNAFRIIKTA